MRRYLVPTVFALSLAAAVPALAADNEDGDSSLTVPRDQWLSPSEITDKLSAQGYKVEQIESDDGAYEVEMVGKNGARLETHVHPATAEILANDDDD
jgi:hypothetical protein